MRKISLILLLSLFASLLPYRTCYCYDENLGYVAKKLITASQALIEMDRSSGTTRVAHKKAAMDALKYIKDTPLEDSETTSRIKEVARKSYGKVSTFKGAVKHSDRDSILKLSMELSQLIVDCDFGSEIFSTTGGFVMSYSMLNSRISDITFPCTHNSYANDKDASRKFGKWYENQGISIYDQLDNGIRWLDMDLGPGDALGYPGTPVYFVHNSGTGGRVELNAALSSIKDFAFRNPHVIIVFEMSDVAKIFGVDDDVSYCYTKLREAIYDTGLWSHVYNMAPKNGRSNSHEDVSTAPSFINPRLMDMIAKGKNILLVPHDNYYKKDRTFFLDIKDNGLKQDYEATHIEERSHLRAVWDPKNIEKQTHDPLRFMSLEFDPDEGATAGDRFFATRNNDGRRIYNLASWYERNMPRNKNINYIKIDYFMDTNIGGDNHIKPVDSVIDACNTINKSRFKFDINYDFLIHLKNNDIIRTTKNLKPEILKVMDAAKFMSNSKWKTSYRDGAITSSGIKRISQGINNYDWWCAPEFAFDNDFSTHWTLDLNGWIKIDLGKKVDFSKVSIVWEYGSANPAFKLLASNDNEDWKEIYNTPMVKGSNNLYYTADVESQSFRYLKLQTISTDREAKASIAELYIE